MESFYHLNTQTKQQMFNNFWAGMDKSQKQMHDK